MIYDITVQLADLDKLNLLPAEGLTYPTAWQPGTSKTASRASGFKYNSILNSI